MVAIFHSRTGSYVNVSDKIGFSPGILRCVCARVEGGSDRNWNTLVGCYVFLGNPTVTTGSGYNQCGAYYTTVNTNIFTCVLYVCSGYKTFDIEIYNLCTTNSSYDEAWVDTYTVYGVVYKRIGENTYSATGDALGTVQDTNYSAYPHDGYDDTTGYYYVLVTD